MTIPGTSTARDRRFESLVPSGSRATPIASGMEWVEGPAYLPAEDALVWSDIPSDRVLRWTPSDGVTEFLSPADFPNGHTVDLDGRLLSCEHGTRRVTRREHDGSRTTLADHFRGKRLNSPNDIVVTRDGSIWFTDPPYGLLSDDGGWLAEPELDGCYVFRLRPNTDGLVAATDELIDPNGLAFSPDESRLYVADSSRARLPHGNHHIFRFDVDAAGNLGPAREFAVIDPGVPDGLRVDELGNVWTSAGDGVHVLDPDGRELGRLWFPEVVANLTFGGRDGRRLFVVATSTVWYIDVGVKGDTTRRPHVQSESQPS